MPFDKAHWQRPRATIATKYQDDDIAYATHGAMIAVDAIRRLAISPDQARGMHLLDYGCGTGRVARILASYFGKVTAYDPVQECIEEAKRECSISFHNLTYVSKLDLTRYDVVVSVNVMEHLNQADQQEMINTIRSVSKFGTVLLLWYHLQANRSVLQRAFPGDWVDEDDVWQGKNPTSTINIRSFTLWEAIPAVSSP